MTVYALTRGCGDDSKLCRDRFSKSPIKLCLLPHPWPFADGEKGSDFGNIVCDPTGSRDGQTFISAEGAFSFSNGVATLSHGGASYDMVEGKKRYWAPTETSYNFDLCFILPKGSKKSHKINISMTYNNPKNTNTLCFPWKYQLSPGAISEWPAITDEKRVTSECSAKVIVSSSVNSGRAFLKGGSIELHNTYRATRTRPHAGAAWGDPQIYEDVKSVPGSGEMIIFDWYATRVNVKMFLKSCVPSSMSVRVTHSSL